MSLGVEWFGNAAGGAGENLGQRRADLRRARAAVLHQIAQQLAHLVEARAVDDRPALSSGFQQACMGEHLEVGAQGVWRRIQPTGDLAGGDAVRSGLDQHSEGGKPTLMRKRGQSDDSGFNFHISNISEIYDSVKTPPKVQRQ